MMNNSEIKKRFTKFFTELELDLNEKQKAKLKSVEYIAYLKFTPVVKK